MDQDAQRRRRRVLLRRAGLLLPVVAVLAAVVVLLYAGGNGRALKRHLRALRAAGHPTSFVELAEREKIPEGVANAAGAYEDAFVAFVPPADETRVPVLGRAELPEPGAPLSEPMVKAIEECLLANQKCLSLLRQATGIEHCKYDRGYDGNTGHLFVMRSCVQLLMIAVLHSGDEGDSSASVAYIKDMLRLSDSVPNEPSLIGHALRTSCTRLSLEGIERTLNAMPLTDAQLQELDRVCARTAASLDVVEAMNVERCFVIEQWTDPVLLGQEPRRLLKNIPGMTKAVLLDLLDYMDDCMEAVALPEPQRLARVEEINRELLDLSFLRVFSKLGAGPSGVRRLVEVDLYCRAQLSITRTALAVERFRLAEGVLPEALEELVPAYLEVVPIDPFGGQPIRYRRAEPGYRLYSVWHDGQDNGGVGQGKAKRGESCDWPFIMTR